MKPFLFTQKMSFLLRSICFLFLVSSFLNTFASARQHLCHPDQRDALTEFKNEFEIQKPDFRYLNVSSFYPKTRSWANQSDCCSWDGITCDAKSGKVIGLDLSSSFLHGQLKSNSSLFRLRHLRDLNLAYNDFTTSPILAEFDNLVGLERLNLSQSSLSGQIPVQLLQLTKLVSLDLSSSSSSLSIDEYFLHGLAQNLRNLRELDMSSVNIFSEIPHEFSNLRSLRFLNLEDCNLYGEFPSSVFLIPNLQSIRLSLNKNLRGNFPVFRENNSLLKLSIQGTAFSGTIPDSISNLKNLTSLTLSYSKFSGKIPISLGNLSHLSSLDLSFSNFVGEIPSSIGNLNQLTDFDVGFNKLSGILPAAIGTLKQLTYFDVRDNKLSGNLPAAVFNLTQLRSLYLSSNQFTGSLPPNVSQFSNLETFDATDNSFTGNILSSLLKIPSLTTIDFDYNHKNNLLGIENISLLPNLQWISIQHNNNNKVDPVDLNVFSPLKQLYSLSLSGIPLSIANITSNSDFLLHLEGLYLSDYNITKFPEFIRNQRNLQSIEIEHNNKNKVDPVDLNVFLPLKQLQRLSLSGIPLSIANITSNSDFLLHLEGLYLSDYNITKFPEFIRNLRNLQWIRIHHNINNKVDPVDLSIFSSMKQLHVLDLSGIPLSTANITSNPDFLSHLEELSLSGCNITKFPEFIGNQKNLSHIDLSNNKIKGQVPDWLWRMPELVQVDLSSNSFTGFNESFKSSLESQISYLNLRSNAFQGPLFIPSMSLQSFYGSKNNFTGEIPRSICGLSSLEVLDLSNNNLHGSIPWCLESQMSSLSDLNLSNNSLSGSLPEIFMNANNLESIDVSHNQLEGKLPASLTGCFALEVLNVGNNRIYDTFPFDLNSLEKLQVLVLRSNKFHGQLHNAYGGSSGFPQLKIIDVSHNDFFGTLPSDYFMNWTVMSSNRDNNIKPEYITSPSGGYYYTLVLTSKGVSMEMEHILTTYTAIDFSSNQLHGQIPDSIGLLKELLILNLSSNAFTGHIPSSLANLTNLESLDLSQNKISGEIPPELGTLSSLEVINVSHNQLEGSIPQGTQFQRQKCSSYEGNPKLFAPSLKDVCGDIKEPTPSQPKPLDTEEEESLSWIAAGLGFAPGVVFGLSMGYIVTSYKSTRAR